MKELLKYRCVVNDKIKEVYYFYELPTNKNILFCCTNLDDYSGHFIPKEQLMMSTGKYDSNDNLIFEGDIVETKFNGLDSKVTFLVVWNDKEALFDGKILKREGTGGYFMAHQDYLYYIIGDDKRGHKTKIIGNKFQNQDLIDDLMKV
jgi:uncharacterized phage protein (TIGR01671 family)